MNDMEIFDYSSIGGTYKGDTIKCLEALENTFSRFDKQYRSKLFELIAIGYDLAIQLVGDPSVWADFCKLERWKGRKIRPRIQTSLREVMHFAALMAFSSETGENDDRAGKYGKLYEYFALDFKKPGEVIELLKERGIEGLLKEATEKYPRRERKSNQNTDSSEAVVDLNRYIQTNCEVEVVSDVTNRETSQDSDLDPHVANRLSQNPTQGQGKLLPLRIEIDVTNEELQRATDMRPGDQILIWAKCVDGPDNWVHIRALHVGTSKN